MQMRIMKKLFILAAATLFAGSIMAAQPEGTAEKPLNTPEVGSWSLGFTFNPVTVAQQAAPNAKKAQPGAGDFANAYIAGLVGGHQLFVLSQDPIAAVRVKYHMKENWNLRMSLGFNGSHITYNEYVQDDLAKSLNPQSENKVIDRVKSDVNATNIAVGCEYTFGKRNLKMVMGANLLYAFAGGTIRAEYGNQITAINQAPSTMAWTATGGAGKLNPDANTVAVAQGIAYARPLEMKNVGFNHGLGFQVDMGIEWFFIERLSLAAAVTFTPVMFVFQPKTYVQYEGFSNLSNQVEVYNDLHSPDGFACLYGTENLGLQLSLNYYFGK